MLGELGTLILNSSSDIRASFGALPFKSVDLVLLCVDFFSTLIDYFVEFVRLFVQVFGKLLFNPIDLRQ